jgi:formylglycine-generating enzyme required for sulfatase activity
VTPLGTALLLLTALRLEASPDQATTDSDSLAGAVRVGNVWVDRFEYPNVPGQLPRVDVSWEEARDLCQQRGQRLCTEAEWEAACLGPESFAYGYGTEFEPGRCNTPQPDGEGWSRSGAAAPSGAYADCRTPDGIHDLVGNVWEWTDGWYDRQQRWRVVRGGSWFHSVNFARADGRFGRFLTPDYRLDLIGFRCCRSAEAEGP